MADGDREETPHTAVPVYSRGWLIYFLAMIVLVGSTLGYTVSGPFYVLGLVSRRAHDTAGRLLRFAIGTLMRLEPWLAADVDLAPHPGALAVSNHRSHLDAFLLLSRIPNVRMVCKKSLFRLPFLGMMMRAMRQIPIRRGDVASYLDAMERVREGVRRGDSVHVFPEMTRCERGDVGTGSFHLAPFNVAFQEKAPVVPIVFLGTDEVWPKGVFGIAFRKPVRVETLEPIDPRAFPSASALAAEVRRRIDARLSTWLAVPAEGA